MQMICCECGNEVEKTGRNQQRCRPCSVVIERKRKKTRQWGKRNPEKIRKYNQQQYYKDVEMSRTRSAIVRQKHKTLIEFAKAIMQQTGVEI
jgi:tRNA(Ile2) C34 agmatinyltransferase TiaS